MIQTSPTITEIDQKKLKLEARYNPKTKRFLDNIAKVTQVIYTIRGSVNAVEISENAKPELIGLLRDMYRDTIKVFDTSSRDYMKNKKTSLEISKEDNKDVQEKVTSQGIFYTNNHSETQAEEITKTTTNKINSAIAFGILTINNKIDKLSNDKLKAQEKITEINQELQANEKISQVLKLKKKKLKLEIRKANNVLEKINNNVNLAVSKEIGDKLKEGNVARSELITEQEIGSTESFIRQEESTALSQTKATYGLIALSTTKKGWDATLDGKTRETHARADGQIVGLFDFFIVGGERLFFPRDPRGSIGNIARCRCEVYYIIG